MSASPVERQAAHGTGGGLVRWTMQRLGWHPEPVGPGEYPLEMTLIATFPALQEQAQCGPARPGKWLAGILALGAGGALLGWISGLPHTERSWLWTLAWCQGGVALGTLLCIVALWLRWRRVARDLRERRLRAEEGELTQKWTSSCWAIEAPPSATASPPAGFFRHLACYERGALVQIQSPCVRIGRRTIEITARDLFELLGAGVRYRVYFTAHAGLPVAIESVGADRGPAGYREAPRRTKGPARAM